MKIKIISYYRGEANQIFATFEYQKFVFDMFKDLNKSPAVWNFLEDQNFEKLKKAVNVDLVSRNCEKYLLMIDNYTF